MKQDYSESLRAAFRLIESGHVEEALGAARQLVSALPQSADAHHLLALCMKAVGNDLAAGAAFQRAAELDPANPHILVNLGNWLKKNGSIDRALDTYRRAVEAAPNFPLAWLNLGIAALASRQTHYAIIALERAVALQPQSATAWHAMGRARRQAEELPLAEAAFREAVRLAPNNGSAWIGLGVTLRFMGRPAEALPYFQKARAVGFVGPELEDAESACLLDLGRLEAALVQIRSLTRTYPSYAAGHASLAHLLWEYGGALSLSEDPFASLRNAAMSQPDNWQLQSELVRFLLEARRPEETLDRIRTLKERPGAPNLMVAEAQALDMLGRRDEARAVFEACFRLLGVSDLPLLNAYQFHLLQSGCPEAAETIGQKAVEAFPDSQESWAYLSTSWRLLNDPREHWLCDYERFITTVEVEPPKEYGDSETFIATLAKTLEPLHQASHEPLQQSLRGGSQTPGRLFGRDDPAIVAAQRELLAAVNRWVADLPNDAKHPFLRRKQSGVREIGSWSVKLWSSGKHVNHIHPQGWMSSAFYVSLPPCVGNAADNSQAGWIQFGQPLELLNLDLAPRRMIQPKVGWLALFPSYMWHGTIPFEDEAPRVTIAFDMLPAP